MWSKAVFRSTSPIRCCEQQCIFLNQMQRRQKCWFMIKVRSKISQFDICRRQAVIRIGWLVAPKFAIFNTCALIAGCITQIHNNRIAENHCDKICGSWSHSINTWTQHWTSIHTILISLWKANSNEEWFWMKSMRALMITSGADQWLSLAECRSVIRAPLHWSEGRPCPDHWLAASLFFYQPTHLIAIFNDICP